MPRKLYAALLVVALASIPEAFALATLSLVFNAILVVGVFFKLREIRFLLFFYLHLFILFLGYATILAIVDKSGSAVLASIDFGSFHVGTTVALIIAWCTVFLYCYSISGKDIELYFSKQILPNRIKFSGISNILSCYTAVAVLSLVLYQSILIKVKRQEIATQLEAIGISYTVIRAHYRLSSEKFDKMTNGLIESDLLGFPKLEDEGGSKDKIDEIKIKINEIQTMLKK